MNTIKERAAAIAAAAQIVPCTMLPMIMAK